MYLEGEVDVSLASLNYSNTNWHHNLSPAHQNTKIIPPHPSINPWASPSSLLLRYLGTLWRGDLGKKPLKNRIYAIYTRRSHNTALYFYIGRPCSPQGWRAFLYITMLREGWCGGRGGVMEEEGKISNSHAKKERIKKLYKNFIYLTPYHPHPAYSSTTRLSSHFSICFNRY